MNLNAFVYVHVCEQLTKHKLSSGEVIMSGEVAFKICLPKMRERILC